MDSAQPEIALVKAHLAELLVKLGVDASGEHQLQHDQAIDVVFSRVERRNAVSQPVVVADQALSFGKFVQLGARQNCGDADGGHGRRADRVHEVHGFDDGLGSFPGVADHEKAAWLDPRPVRQGKGLGNLVHSETFVDGAQYFRASRLHAEYKSRVRS